MKKHLILTLGLALTSPLLLAQNSGSSDDQKDENSATPATPAIPAVPGGSSPTVEGPTTNDDGSTSGSARSGKNSAGATGNPDTKSAKTRTRSGGGNEFGSLDSNGDNKISQDELKVNVELGAKFGSADTNSDGSLSRGEFAKLQSNPTSNATGRDSKGRDNAKQERTEGSDKTKKDDELNRQLPGQ